jgi:hypothetical protein
MAGLTAFGSSRSGTLAGLGENGEGPIGHHETAASSAHDDGAKRSTVIDGAAGTANMGFESLFALGRRCPRNGDGTH